MITADNFHRIGHSHNFCQDFSSSKVMEDKGYAIISDGCSSAKDSEVGSMLLVKTAEQHLYPIRPMTQLREMMNVVIHTANVHRRALGLDIDALCATLLTICTTPNSFVTTITGDGVIVARHKTKGLQWIDHEFESGAPFYARYNLSSADRQKYLELFKGKLCRRDSPNPNENAENKEVLETPVEVNEETIDTYGFEFPFADYDMVGVMSDGAKSFTKKERTGTSISHQIVDLKEIIKEVFSFKTFAGDFVKRRCKRAFEQFTKQGWENQDDFSIAVMSNVGG